MTFPRYLPDGGSQVPQPYEDDAEVAEARHRPDVMEEFIADHQQQPHRVADRDEAGDRQTAGPLRRLLARLLGRT